MKEFIGHFIHSASLIGGIEILENRKIIVDDLTGQIVSIDKLDYDLDNSSEFYCPGFIDAHLHAPQFPNLGVGLDQPLLLWLQNVTFPTESKYQVTDYEQLVSKLLSRGTTTAVYFGNLRNEENLRLLRAIEDMGQRALVGKVCMDISPYEDYVENTKENIKGSIFFKESSSRVKPIITPRFALSCTSNLMNGLAKLAKEHDLFIQTHISENKEEIEQISQLFPEHPSYADVYDAHGLLSDKTLLAHGVHLTESEMQLIRIRQSCLIHCPLSNYALNSGIARVRDWLNKDIKVALGTDISGGTSLSMRAVILSALNASKSIQMLNDSSYQPLTIYELFYLATKGAAKCLQLNVGTFEVGQQFDAILIRNDSSKNLGGIDHLNLEQKFQQFLYGESSEQICKVFVDGCLVSDSSDNSK